MTRNFRLLFINGYEEGKLMDIKKANIFYDHIYDIFRYYTYEIFNKLSKKFGAFSLPLLMI